MGRPQTTRRDTLNFRIKAEDRGLIERAATITGKTLAEFVLDGARRAAEEALLSRTVFNLSPVGYAALMARLDAPPEPNERLRRSMQAAPPWE